MYEFCFKLTALVLSGFNSPRMKKMFENSLIEDFAEEPKVLVKVVTFSPKVPGHYVKVEVKVWEIEESEGEVRYDAEASHNIKTPSQATPYRKIARSRTPDGAIKELVQAIGNFHRSAVMEGGTPSPDWYVKAE